MSRITRRDFLRRLAPSPALAPGAALDSSAGTTPVTLRSDAEGVWAQSPGGDRIALRSGSAGVILANPAETWPANRLLSHATGEPMDRGAEPTTQQGGIENG